MCLAFYVCYIVLYTVFLDYEIVPRRSTVILYGPQTCLLSKNYSSIARREVKQE